ANAATEQTNPTETAGATPRGASNN
ncbi:unnamed protein product, partial [Onchocerca ochengi]